MRKFFFANQYKMKIPSKSRGRPRTYNPEKVIEEALQVFWRKGFSATSLDDLVDATGINRPSLYAGFGDKEKIYLTVLDHFRAIMTAKLQDTLISRGRDDTVADAVNRYLSEVIEIYLGSADEALGCAVLCTTASEARNHKGIREMLAETLQLLDDVFETYLANAQREGNLPTDLDCVSLARVLCAIQHSLALRARSGQSRKQLQTLVDAAVNLIN
jgi:AcrR family transcriptional regulator